MGRDHARGKAPRLDKELIRGKEVKFHSELAHDILRMSQGSSNLLGGPVASAYITIQYN